MLRKTPLFRGFPGIHCPDTPPSYVFRPSDQDAAACGGGNRPGDPIFLGALDEYHLLDRVRAGGAALKPLEPQKCGLAVQFKSEPRGSPLLFRKASFVP